VEGGLKGFLSQIMIEVLKYWVWFKFKTFLDWELPKSMLADGVNSDSLALGVRDWTSFSTGLNQILVVVPHKLVSKNWCILKTKIETLRF
jgi:hypothetical protein